MFCPNCAAEHVYGLRYCKQCGTNLLDAPTPQAPALPAAPKVAGAAWVLALATVAITLGGLGIVFTHAFDLMRMFPGEVRTGEATPVAIVMLVFGALVVINRNPIASALSLVVCFLGLSALFMSLDAFFIGIIQVLVYAGAVMVLFLFIIMLLDLRAEERRKLNWIAFGGGFLVAFSLLVQILAVIGSTGMAKQTFPPLASQQTDDVRSVGLMLFGNYNLPFQVIAVLILVATIGVIVLSKRQFR